MIVYFNGSFIHKEEVRISPDDRGILFADGVYEVVRSYNGKLFRLEDHLKRMERSLREVRIDGPDIRRFGEIVEKLMQENNLGDRDATVYMQISRGVASPRKHTFPEKKTTPTIYMCPAPLESSHAKSDKGVRVILVHDMRGTRCDIKSLALLPNVLANQQAKESGAEEAVFVRDGAVTEGSHTNFCAVFDGQVFTFPESNYILAGITRSAVLELCGKLNIPLKEFPVFEKDLKNADECMILGTTTEVMPVVQVDNWQVGDGKPGPITLKLQRAFREQI